jgi:hypothetical protein
MPDNVAVSPPDIEVMSVVICCVPHHVRMTAQENAHHKRILFFIEKRKRIKDMANVVF